MSVESRYTIYVHVLTPGGLHYRNCFSKRSSEAVEKQDLTFAKNNDPAKTKKAVPSGQNDMMFVKEDDPVEEGNTVVAFNRSTDGEKLIVQKSRHKDFDA